MRVYGPQASIGPFPQAGKGHKKPCPWKRNTVRIELCQGSGGVLQIFPGQLSLFITLYIQLIAPLYLRIIRIIIIRQAAAACNNKKGRLQSRPPRCLKTEYAES